MEPGSNSPVLARPGLNAKAPATNQRTDGADGDNMLRALDRARGLIWGADTNKGSPGPTVWLT